MVIEPAPHPDSYGAGRASGNLHVGPLQAAGLPMWSAPPSRPRRRRAHGFATGLHVAGGKAVNPIHALYTKILRRADRRAMSWVLIFLRNVVFSEPVIPKTIPCMTRYRHIPATKSSSNTSMTGESPNDPSF
jgi:hypothetical protein